MKLLIILLIFLTSCTPAETVESYVVARVKSIQDNTCELIQDDQSYTLQFSPDIGIGKAVEESTIVGETFIVDNPDLCNTMQASAYVNVKVTTRGKKVISREVDSIAEQIEYVGLIFEDGGVLIGDTVYYFNELKGVPLSTEVHLLCVKGIGKTYMKIISVGGQES